MNEEPILIGQKGTIGWVTLNRPKSLNALNHIILEGLFQALKQWKEDKEVQLVVIEGSGRAFCAGGDIRMLREAYLEGRSEIAEHWLHQEYDLNLLIHKYPKPYIALLNGITMGGGMGISIHGSHRIATENTVMAMPETSIGFFPDIGARWFLSRCPGKTGLYLGLTSSRIGPEDALYCKLATHFVSESSFVDLKKDLESASASQVDEIIAHYQGVPAKEGFLREHQSLIDELFDQPSLEDIFRALSKHKSDFAHNTLKALEKRSPLGLRTTFDILKNAENLTIEEALAADKQLCLKFTRSEEFMEGIRAAVVDKDGQPNWPSEPIRY